MWCLRRLRFETVEMEIEFQSRHQVTARRFCFLWLTVQCFLVAATTVAGVAVFGVPIPLLVCQGCVVAFLLLIILGLRYSQHFGRHVYVCQCTASVVAIGWTGWLVHFVVSTLGDRVHTDTLRDVWPLLAGFSAYDKLETYIMTELSGKILLLCLLYNFFVLDLLRFAGSVSGLAIACAALPLTFCLVTFASEAVQNNVTEMLAATVLVAIYAFLSGAYLSLLRRRHFALDYQLRRLLLQEADTERRAREGEAAQKVASQLADSTLNHLLKNLMADASGCIEMSLGKPPAEAAAHLREALACMGRGMQWCRRRHIILGINQGSYRPCLAPVNLRDFGRALMNGRRIFGSFLDRVVLLDPTLCELILDNAISNALRHGCPADPDVHFTLRLSRLPPKAPCSAAHPGGSPPLALTFCVTNRADPARPPLTQSFVDRVVAGEAVPHSRRSVLSDSLGLQHMFHAAHTYGLQLRLEQVGDTVIFTADLEVFEADKPIISVTNLVPGPPPSFPVGTRILCLDDSDVARRLMVHSLQKFGGAVGVQAFGRDAQELEAFLEEALASAHLLVMDQHLDYQPVSYLGTDLVRRLLAKGFRGLICIRSANTSPEDTELFLHSGAHCVIPKDMPVRAMVEELQHQYVQHWAQQQPVEEDAPNLPGSTRHPLRRLSPRAPSDFDLQDADACSPLSDTSSAPSPTQNRPLLPSIPNDASFQSAFSSFSTQFDLMM